MVAWNTTKKLMIKWCTDALNEAGNKTRETIPWNVTEAYYLIAEICLSLHCVHIILEIYVDCIF